jgi:hypothetical protein
LDFSLEYILSGAVTYNRMELLGYLTLKMIIYVTAYYFVFSRYNYLDLRNLLLFKSIKRAVCQTK